SSATSARAGWRRSFAWTLGPRRRSSTRSPPCPRISARRRPRLPQPGETRIDSQSAGCLLSPKEGSPAFRERRFQTMSTELKTLPVGTFCWVDLGTTDTKSAKAFYTALFNWQTEDKPMGEGKTYTMCTLDGKMVAGIMDLPQEARQMG